MNNCDAYSARCPTPTASPIPHHPVPHTGAAVDLTSAFLVGVLLVVVGVVLLAGWSLVARGRR